jgi:hypothetical protein
VRLPTSIVSLRRRALPLALGVVALAATACDTGSTSTGHTILGFNNFGANLEDGPNTYGVGAHPTLAYQTSGRGSELTDNVGVSTNWQLQWKDSCGSSFSAVPKHQRGYGYETVPGASAVSGASGAMAYTNGTGVTIAVTAPASCTWSIQILNLWTGGPSHS